jgi:hypothetical protein
MFRHALIVSLALFVLLSSAVPQGAPEQSGAAGGVQVAGIRVDREVARNPCIIVSADADLYSRCENLPPDVARACVAVIEPLISVNVPISVALEEVSHFRSCGVSEDVGDGINIEASGIYEYLRGLGLSDAQAKSQIRIQTAALRLRADAMTLFPATFAGMHIDHQNGGRVTSRFTEEPQSSLDTLLLGAEASAVVLPNGDSLSDAFKASGATYSLTELHAFMELILTEYIARGEGRDLPHLQSLGVRVLQNKVRVGVISSGTEAFAPQVPSDAYFLESEAPFVDDLDPTETRCRPHGTAIIDVLDNCQLSRYLRGGLHVELEGVSNCTIGFLATRGSSNLAISAGHCWDDGGDMTHGEAVPQRDIGRFDQREYPIARGTVDAASWFIDEAFNKIFNPDGWTPTRWVVYKSTSQAFPMTDAVEVNEIMEGAWLNSVGQTGGARGGTVEDPSGTFLSGGAILGSAVYVDMIRMSYDTDPGDSGGPLFTTELSDTGISPSHQRNTAVGILKGSNGQSSFWSKIANVEAALDLTIRTN